MEQPLTVQEPYPLHHVESNLHPRPKVQPDLESSVEVSRVAGHDEENHGVGAIGVVIINKSTYQVDYSVVLRQSPGGRGRGVEVNLKTVNLQMIIGTFYDLEVHPVNAEV